MNLDKKALAGFVKEVEDSRLRQKAETDYQRDVFARARKSHFDVKALRIVLQRRAMEPGKRDEQDYNVHAYEHALGAKKDAIEDMERGATAREAAKKHGLPRAAVTSLKAGAENEIIEPTTPHDPETGIIDLPAAGVPAAPAVSDGSGFQSCGGGETQTRTDQEVGPAEALVAQPPAQPQPLGPCSEAGVAPGPQDTIDLAIPAHLDRRHERARA